MVNNTVRAILSAKWLINKEWAEGALPAVMAVLKGGNWAAEPKRTGSGAWERPFLVNPKTMERVPMYVYDRNMGDYVTNPNIANLGGAVAVVPVSGPIMKYDGDCGEAGSITRSSWLMQVDALAGVTGVVIVWDTPGGMVDGTDTLASTIKNMSKYTISYVDDGMCCSAGMWGATSAKELYTSKKSDTVGSIGVLCTVADFAGYYEQLGIKVESIYAPQSAEKNIEYRKWQSDGDASMIQADLAVIADDFINAIKANRPGATRHEAKWSTGATFYANEAQRIGLIDGIMPLSKVIQRAHFKGKSLTNMSTTTNTGSAAETSMQTVLTAAGAEQFAVVAAGDISAEAGFIVSEEALNAVAAQLTTLGDQVAGHETAMQEMQSQLHEANEALQAAGSEQSSALAALQTQLDEAVAANATLTEANATLTQDNDTLQAQVEELGKGASGNGSTLIPSNKPEGSGKPSWYVPDGSEAKLDKAHGI